MELAMKEMYWTLRHLGITLPEDRSRARAQNSGAAGDSKKDETETKKKPADDEVRGGARRKEKRRPLSEGGLDDETQMLL